MIHDIDTHVGLWFVIDCNQLQVFSNHNLSVKYHVAITVKYITS